MSLDSNPNRTDGIKTAAGYSRTGEPYVTIEELSSRINVSAKTIRRWGTIDDNPLSVHKKKIGGRGRDRRLYLMSEVASFKQNHQKKFDRAVRMKSHDKQEIITTAVEMLAAMIYDNRTQLINAVADRIGSSADTVRKAIKSYEAKNTDNLITDHFENNPSVQNALYHEVVGGTSMRAACNMYDINQGNGSDMLTEAYGRRLSVVRGELDRPGYMYDSKYEAADAEDTFLGPAPDPGNFKLPKTPSGLPPYLRDLYQFRLLSREEEEYFLRRMNFRWYQISQMCANADEGKPQLTHMRQMEAAHSDAKRIENFVWEHNLRLVVSIIKRLNMPIEDWEEYISEGNMSLRNCIRKLDPFRGNKLSTYASWGIMRNTNTYRDKKQRKESPIADMGEMLDNSVIRATEHTEEEQLTQRDRQTLLIEQLLARLDHREQRILRSRFGLGEEQEPRTLKEVGAELGVTKERIRQIECRALDKLRAIAQETGIKPDDLLVSLVNDRHQECVVIANINDQNKMLDGGV